MSLAGPCPICGNSSLNDGPYRFLGQMHLFPFSFLFNLGEAQEVIDERIEKICLLENDLEELSRIPFVVDGPFL